MTYQVVAEWPSLSEGCEIERVTGIATDADDRVYVFHSKPHPVLCFGRDGRLVHSWGDGEIEAAHGLRVEGDRVWLTDTARHQVLECTLDGKPLRAFGRRGEAGVGKGQFNMPTDVAVAPDGDVYVSDGYGNSRVVKFSKDGDYLFEWGTKGTGPGEFDQPHNVRLDAEGRVYVADRENHRIQVFTPEGKFLAEWRHVGKPFGLFITPDQSVFVTDAEGDRVLMMSLDGEIRQSWGTSGAGPGQFQLPHAICVDRCGDVYVGEVTGERVQKFTRSD